MFACGMGIIFAATVLNIAHDRLSGSGLERLPQPLANMYYLSGKLGVTLLFVSAGMSIIMLGILLPSRQRRRAAAAAAADPVPAAPYFCDSTTDDEGREVTPAGVVVLKTRKYLSPASNLSGSTGWPAARTAPK
jgi:hypothetical protein